MAALLYCRTGPMSGASFKLDAETTVGRTPEHVVTLSDERISSRHARIWQDAESGEWMVQDLESRNGTLVDGSPAAEPVPLGELSIITFARRFDFIFQVVESDMVDAPVRRSMPSPDPAPRVSTRAEGAAPSLPDMTGDNEGIHTRAGGAAPSLPDIDPSADDDVHTRFGGDAPTLPDVDDSSDAGLYTRAGGPPPDLPDAVDSRSAGTTDAGASPKPDNESVSLHLDTSDFDRSDFELRQGGNVIGRSSDCDIRIDDASLSRSHAVITIDGARVSIRDNGSKNGTFVDGEQITSDRTIYPENRLRFGPRIEGRISSDREP